MLHETSVCEEAWQLPRRHKAYGLPISHLQFVLRDKPINNQF